MGYTKSFVISNLLQDKFINEFSNFGWILTIKNDTRFNPARPVLGGIFTNRDVPLKELTFEQDKNAPKELNELTNKYLKTKEQQIKALYPSVGGFVTAIVFGSIFTFAGLITLFLSIDTNNTNGITTAIIMLAIFFPAILLGSYGARHRNKSYEKTVINKSNEIKELIAEANKIRESK